KHIVARVILRRSSPQLQRAGVALAVSSGQEAALPTFRTASLQRPVFSYEKATGDGRLTRYSPPAFYYRGALGSLAEYVHSEQRVRAGGIHSRVRHDAWQIAVTYVLTGETATEGGVRPIRD